MSFQYRDGLNTKTINRGVLINILWSAFFFLPISMYLLTFNLDVLQTNASIHINMANNILIFIYLWSVISWIKITKNYASLYLLFLINCLFFNAGQTIMWYIPDFGYTYPNIYEIYQNEYIFKMLIFQSLAIIAMHLGALLSCTFFSTRHLDVTNICTDRISVKSKLLDFMFYFFSALMLADSFIQLLLRVQYSYAEYYNLRESTSGYLIALFFWSFISYFLRHAKGSKKVMYSIVIMQILLMLVIGRRSQIIAILSCVLFLQVVINPDVFKNKRKILKYVSIGIIIAFLIGFTAELRSFELDGISSYVSLLLSSKGPVFYLVNAIQEMGLTARTIITTMMEIDNGFQHQGTILYDLTKAFIPTSILSNFGINEPTVGALSAWITSIGMSSSGWGYSFIAEAYFNFGMLGFIFTGIYGFVVGFLELLALKKIDQGRLLIPTAIIYLLSNQIFFARAHFGLTTSRIRLVIYLLIICYIYKLIVSKKKPKTMLEFRLRKYREV